MKSTIRLALLLAGASLASSCAHWVPVQVTVPANKSLPGVRTIAVAPFEEKVPLARQMRLGERVASGVTDGIASHNIVMAQRCAAPSSGGDAALASNAPAGCDAVLTGEVHEAAVNDTAPVTTYMTVQRTDAATGRQVTERVRRVAIERSARLGVSYRLLRRPNGEMVCSDLVSHDTSNSQTGSSTSEAHGRLPAPERMIESLLPGVIESFVADLTPRTVQDRRRLLSGDEVGKLALQAAKNGLWDEAQLYWEESAETAEKPKDRAAAYYNLAVYYEVHNNFERALEMLGEARHLQPDRSLFLKYQKQIHRRERQFLDVEQQRVLMETPVDS